MKRNWKVYVIWIAIAEVVGALSGLLSIKGMQAYSETVTQPAVVPPMWVFPVVWGILYALMGLSAAIVWLSPESDLRRKGLNLFVAQLIVNFFWSIIFFNLRVFLFAAIWILLLLYLIIRTIIKYYKINKTAAFLQIPYLVWVSFATYLTFAIWYLNR